MIVALLILIVLILLFGAAAVKSAISRILLFMVAVCIGGIGLGTMGDSVGVDGPAYLLATVSAVVFVGGALLLAAASLPDSNFRKGLKRNARKRRRHRLLTQTIKQDEL